jgi:hypothetical protein
MDCGTAYVDSQAVAEGLVSQSSWAVLVIRRVGVDVGDASNPDRGVYVARLTVIPATAAEVVVAVCRLW